MNQPATQFVGAIPEHYDIGLGPVLFEAWGHELARRAAARDPGRVLELAAGTGIVTRHLRDQLPAGCELVATDLNAPMLEVAKRKFRPEEQVVFEQADAMDLHYDSGAFDLVLCQFGVMFFPDKVASHAEVRRVLRPRGEYLFTLWDSWEANPFARTIHDTVARFFPDDPPGFYQVPYGYHDADEIRAAALAGGFAEVTIQRLELPVKIGSAENFAQGLVCGNPLHAEVLARGGDPDAVREAVERTIVTEVGDQIVLRILLAQAS